MTDLQEREVWHGNSTETTEPNDYALTWDFEKCLNSFHSINIRDKEIWKKCTEQNSSQMHEESFKTIYVTY